MNRDAREQPLSKHLWPPDEQQQANFSKKKSDLGHSTSRYYFLPSPSPTLHVTVPPHPPTPGVSPPHTAKKHQRPKMTTFSGRAIHGASDHR